MDGHPLGGSETSLRLHYVWTRVGSIRLDAPATLSMPPMPATPGVYRIVAGTDDATETYVGETDNLRRRFHVNYRSPGSSQQTNIRIKAWLLERLAHAIEVHADIVIAASIEMADESPTIDLSLKWQRRLIENAAIGATNLGRVLNL